MAKDSNSNLKQQLHGHKQSACDPNQNIQVFVRMRPLNKDKERRNNIDVFSDRNEVRLGERNNVQAKQCLFDGVFDDKSCQIEVYKRVVSPLIQQVLDGYNCTVFAYGKSCSSFFCCYLLSPVNCTGNPLTSLSLFSSL